MIDSPVYAVKHQHFIQNAIGGCVIVNDDGNATFGNCTYMLSCIWLLFCRFEGELEEFMIVNVCHSYSNSLFVLHAGTPHTNRLPCYISSMAAPVALLFESRL